MNPRLCLIGETRGSLDEGTRNLFESLRQAFPTNINRMDLPAHRFLQNLTSVRAFGPDAIIYLTGPTIRSLAYLEVLRRMSGGIPRIVLGAHPMLDWGSLFGHLLRPERFLALSKASLMDAVDHEVSSSLFMLGVDRMRFRPITAEAKEALRKDLNIPAESHVVLHVGHWRSGRNISLLGRISRNGHQMVFVASPRFSAPPRERRFLEWCGARVICDFVPDIERFYQAADVYVFPVRMARGAIEQPLSVLEALATGIPVVAFPVGGIHDIAESYQGLHLVSTEEGLLAALDESREQGLPEPIRIPPDWESVAMDLVSEVLAAKAG